MKLLYIAENINPVFYSQVVTLLNQLATKNIFSDIYLAIGQRKLEKVDIIGLNNNIKIIKYKTYPIYPIFNSITEYSIFKQFKKHSINNDFIIHTRSEFIGLLAYNAYIKLKSGKPNIIVDIRGAVIEEVEIYGKMNKILKYLKLFNYKSNIKKFLMNVKYINVVSNELKEYIKINFNLKNKSISVIPTIAGDKFKFDKEERKKTRKLLNIKENETLFIFSSGSEQTWQNNDKIVKSLTEKGYKILMLTKKTYTTPNVISKFVHYSEVPNYLNAADIGIVIRNNDVVNNVASPIKFSEYICNGLPVIANDSVEIINQLLENNALGYITDLNNVNHNMIEKLKYNDRSEISKQGIEIFGINKITASYIKIYNNIKNNNLKGLN